MSTIIPSSPEDLKKIRAAVLEAVDSHNRIAAEKDLIKDIRENVKEKYKVSPRDFNRMVRTEMKQNFSQQEVEFETFEELYTKVMAHNTAPDQGN